MGQIRSSENIGRLTKTSSTTVQLAPSTINIGAFQYKTSTPLILSLGVSGAGGRQGMIFIEEFYY